MAGNFDELKVVRVIMAAGEVQGRVRLQKLVYLLTALDFDLPYDDFRILQRGPYSPSLANTIDALKWHGFLKEARRRVTEEVTEYRYRASKGIASVLKAVGVASVSGAARVSLEQAVSELLRHDVHVLEVAATRLYLSREERLTGQKLDRELLALKGHLQAHFPKAISLLKSLQEKGWLS